MDPITQSALIGGGTALASSFLSSKDQGQPYKTRKLQRQMAKESIRWRVTDAKAAGIHPLAALGVSPQTVGPATVGSTIDDKGIGQMGQNLQRAVAARQTDQERQLARLAVKQAEKKALGMDLDNQLKAKAIMEMDSEKAGPPEPKIRSGNTFGIQGQDSSAAQANPGTILKPVEQSISKKIGTEAGIHPGETDFMVGKNLIKAPSQKLSEPMESSLDTKISMAQIKMSNRLAKAAWFLKRGINSSNNIEAKQFYNRLRKERATLPKQRYMIWKARPYTNTWILVPNTKANRKSIFYNSTHPEPY